MQGRVKHSDIWSKKRRIGNELGKEPQKGEKGEEMSKEKAGWKAENWGKPPSRTSRGDEDVDQFQTVAESLTATMNDDYSLSSTSLARPG